MFSTKSICMYREARSTLRFNIEGCCLATIMKIFISRITMLKLWYPWILFIKVKLLLMLFFATFFENKRDVRKQIEASKEIAHKFFNYVQFFVQFSLKTKLIVLIYAFKEFRFVWLIVLIVVKFWLQTHYMNAITCR